MDDNLSEVQADETLATDEQQSEADAPDHDQVDEAETVADDKSDPEAESSEETEQETEKPKKRSGIERLKRQLADSRAEIEMLRMQAEKTASSEDISRAVESEIGAPPKEEDYSSWYEYERALTAYETEKRIVSREIRKQSQHAQAHQNARAQAIADEFVERETEVAAAIPDYYQAAKAVEHVPVSDTIARMILESDKGALLKYHFAKNTSELEALNNLDPISAARAIGRLEQRLSLPNTNRATRAQKPPVPVKGGAGVMSDEAKLEAYLNRIYGKRRA